MRESKKITKAGKQKVTRWIDKCIKNQEAFLEAFGTTREIIVESDCELDDIVWNYADDELGAVDMWTEDIPTKQFMEDEIGRLWDAIEGEYKKSLMVKFKLKEDVFSPDLNWKKDTTYSAKRIEYKGQKCIEAYFPGSPIITIFPLDYVEIIKSDKKK